MGRAPSGEKRAVYYAIDDTPKYQFLTLMSIRSLRSHNGDITVHVYYFGQRNQGFARALRKLGAKLVLQPVPGRNLRTSLKWLCLSKLRKFDRVLYVDSDTGFFKDVDRLFDRLATYSFYAREEVNCSERTLFRDPTGRRHRVQVHARKFLEALKKYGGEQMPIFNTGIMLFNQGVHRTLGRSLKLYERIIRDFHSDRTPYPSANWHIVNEVASSLWMSSLGVDWAYLPAKDSPWFIEWRMRSVRSPGIVMHYWMKYVHEYLLQFEGMESLREFSAYL